MPTFVLLTKLCSDVMKKPSRREAIGKAWMKAVKAKCPDVKWIDHYALLGPYDFLDIYEAADEETAAKVSLITMSKGAVKAESWTAIPYQRFLEITKGL
ncbi:MAG: GYD family protein [Ignavibacteriales bacterium CG07_land_8_20_14_0_80_59_12]|jgi:uncharacterized protein with GYD domain|nr:MAG: GYD family protein [Ignavibacteriales bacterium CG07_land_8_20_14_0_80_59_12]